MPSVKDMTTYASPAPSPVVRLVRQLGIDTQYVLLGFPLGIITITLFMSMFFTGLGLVVLWVGIPLMVVTLMTARGFAAFERVRIGPVLGRKVPHPYYKKATGGSVIRNTSPIENWTTTFTNIVSGRPSSWWNCWSRESFGSAQAQMG